MRRIPKGNQRSIIHPMNAIKRIQRGPGRLGQLGVISLLLVFWGECVLATVPPPEVQIEKADNGQWGCTFTYRPEIEARSVALAGTFNSWNMTSTPMSGPDDAGCWTVRIELPDGIHQYKFVVNGDRWFRDPGNPDTMDDGHSGKNSVLRLGRLGELKVSKGAVGDGEIETAALEHDPHNQRYLQLLSGSRALIRLRTLAHDVQQAQVVGLGKDLIDMTRVHEDDCFALWEAVAKLPGSATDTVAYSFIITDGELSSGGSPDTYRVTPAEMDVLLTPEWAKHAIWYQIFPERFRDGDPTNNPDDCAPWTMDWFELTPKEKADGATFYKYAIFRRHYGGDIAGVEEKLPYLKELGVNALYFNPVFEAASSHKYDATNYLHIDDNFGTKGDYEAVAAAEDLLDPSTWQWTKSDERFLRFIKKAHSMGFKIIIDGVFNHVGRPHPAFQDVLKNGSQSPYADWFDVTSWEPFEYEGWAGFGELPVFKKDADGLASESVKQHIFNVTRRWMDPDGDGDPSDGIDGWRLDVPNEIPAPFWVEWRQVVKKVNPNAYITGEIWDNAGSWLDGKHFDAVMNYQFSRAVVAWAFDETDKITTWEFDRRLRELRLAYPLEATLALQNLMDSHDTDRVASMAHNPDRAYDHANRIQDNGPKYRNDKPTSADYGRARLAAVIQMTYVGAPMIYYGDEVGMWGADDPNCRKPMLWEDLGPYAKPLDNEIDTSSVTCYQQTIALRNAHPALRTGTFETLLIDDLNDIYAFLRKNDDEQLIVVLNASADVRIVDVPVPANAPTVWNGVLIVKGDVKVKDGTFRTIVPPLCGIVWHAATPK